MSASWLSCDAKFMGVNSLGTKKKPKTTKIKKPTESHGFSGTLVIMSDRVEFQPDGSSLNCMENIKIPFNCISGVTREGFKLLIKIAVQDQLFQYEFADVVIVAPFHSLLQHFSTIPTSSLPAVNAEYISRVCFPKEHDQRKIVEETVENVLPGIITITTHNVHFLQRNIRVPYTEITNIYPKSTTRGGVEVLRQQSESSRLELLSFADIPVPYVNVLIQAWLNFMYASVMKGKPAPDIIDDARTKTKTLLSIYKQFFALDLNHDGSVSNEELAEALGPVLSPRIEEMLNYIDTNRDGVMSFKEYLTAMSATAFPSQEKLIFATMQLLDLDHNGVLSDEEIINAVFLIVQRSSVKTVIDHLRKKFGDGERMNDVEVDLIARELLDHHASVLNVQGFQQSEKHADNVHAKNAEHEPVTLGHTDWVLSTFIMRSVSVLETENFSVTSSQMKLLEKYGSPSDDFVPATNTVFITTYERTQFSELRKHFGFASEYYRSLNLEAIFNAMVKGQDMGVFNSVVCEDEKDFRFVSRDGLFQIRSLDPTDASKLLRVLPEYIEFITAHENTESYLPRYLSISKLLFRPSGKERALETYFVIFVNPLRTLTPISGLYDWKGITGRMNVSKGSTRQLETNKFESNLKQDIVLSEHLRTDVFDQLARDTEFLEKVSAEYSLIVATTSVLPQETEDATLSLTFAQTMKREQSMIVQTKTTKRWCCCGATEIREPRRSSIAKAIKSSEPINQPAPDSNQPSLGENDVDVANWMDSGYTRSSTYGMSIASDYEAPAMTSAARYMEGIPCQDFYTSEKEASIFLFFSNIRDHADALTPEQFRMRLLTYVEDHIRGDIGTMFEPRGSTGAMEAVEVDAKAVSDNKKIILLLDPRADSLTITNSKRTTTFQQFPLKEINVVRSHHISKKKQTEVLLRHISPNGDVDYSVEISLASALKSEWIFNRIRKYCCKEPSNVVSGVHTANARIFIGTWNVGSKSPFSLNPWLRYGAECDLMIISSQECIPKDEWLKCLDAGVPTGFVMLHHAACWDIHVVAYVRTSSLHRVSHIEAHTEATGVGHVLGNKGGVCITLRIDDSSFAFFGSHLAAHLEKVEQRNSDFSEVLGEISLSLSPTAMDLTNAVHHVFWCGDLNYRLEGEFDTVVSLAQQGAFEELFKMDQLRREMEKNNVFFGFKDSQPYFPPTYKYVVNTGPTQGVRRVYDADLGRIPSWCDRILYHPIVPDSVVDRGTLQQFGCCNEIQTSDHSPVYAIYNVSTRLFNNCGRPPQCPTTGCKFALTLTSLVLDGKESVDPDVTVTIQSRLFQSTKIKKGFAVEIKVPITMEDSLKQEYVFVGVEKFALLRNVPIGSGVIPLYAESFNVPLTNGGQPIGNIKGSVIVS